ncbi:MAG: peptidyl-prolyl cis-trans isomerase [Actinomycetota bacterium]
MVGLAALLGLVGLAAWFVRVIWPPLILAGAIVFILNPVVTRAQHHGIPRVLATALSYLCVVLLLGMTVLLVYPLARDQAKQLGDDWPDIRHDLQHRLDDLAEESDSWPIKVPTWKEFEDEFGSGKRFDKPGLLAMANAGPNTNGSQFFITEVATPHLNSRHTIFGEVVKGLDLIPAIARAGNAQTKLEKVTITRSEKVPQ